MAKKFKESPKKEVYNYPSRYGSHTSMVDLEETKKLHDVDLVVCKDEYGLYVTHVKQLVSGLADPYRSEWLEDRTKKMEKYFSEMIDIV